MKCFSDLCTQRNNWFLPRCVNDGFTSLNFPELTCTCVKAEGISVGIHAMASEKPSGLRVGSKELSQCKRLAWNFHCSTGWQERWDQQYLKWHKRVIHSICLSDHTSLLGSSLPILLFITHCHLPAVANWLPYNILRLSFSNNSLSPSASALWKQILS